MGRRAAALVWLPLLCCHGGIALAQPAVGESKPAEPAVLAAPSVPVAVRTGNHPGFGRLVLDFPARPRFTTERRGDVMVLKLATPAKIGTIGTLPRNVRGATAGPGELEITLAPGAQTRVTVLGGRLVVDVLDPSAAAEQAKPATAAPPTPTPTPTPPQAPATPTPAPSTLRTPGPGGRARQAQAPSASVREPPAAAFAAPSSASSEARPTSTQAAPPVARATPPAQPLSGGLKAVPAEMADRPAPTIGAAPVELLAASTSLPDGQDGAAITLPFAATTGAAAFRRGNQGMVVFDEKRPVDLGELRDDPVFDSALVQLLPNATLLRLPLPPDRELSLTRSSSGWVVAVVPGPVPLKPIQIAVADSKVTFAAGSPGQVLIVADPNTGGNLLVGTQRASGQGTAVIRRTPEFVLLPTWQGVVVEPQSDRPLLRPVPTGFTLTAGAPDGLAVSATDADTVAQANAAALTRSFDFPEDSVRSLMRRMQSQVGAAATAPPMARLAPREEAAQSMISLGMGAEAQALLQLAVAEDPRAAMDPLQIGLSAVAALLADRLEDATPITDNRLSATDELALWRAVREAKRQEGSPAAAAVFAAEMPLLLAYPQTLRDRLLPLAAETMTLGGQAAAAARLLAQQPDNPDLAMARAMLAQAQGKTGPALAAYDALADGRDQLQSARAALRAVQLRLSSGGIGPDKAADAAEHLLYAWRGDGWEVALRRQIAEWRSQAGQWRQALSMLRESEPLFPDDAPALHAQLLDTFSRVLTGDAAKQMEPLDLVAFAEENADLLPAGPAGEAMAATLADRLQALDLPQRADPVLERLAQTASAGASRGAFGLQLAALRLKQGNPAGALAALNASAADGQSASLAEQRILLQARAVAAAGDTASAISLLQKLGTASGDDTRAGILEAAKDWPGATSALTDYVARVVPADGPLNSQQAHILLRLASAAAQAGDEAVLARLRRDDGDRIAALKDEPKLDEMFRFLTQTPIASSGDLPRAARETATVRNLPDAIAKLDHTATK